MSENTEKKMYEEIEAQEDLEEEEKKAEESIDEEIDDSSTAYDIAVFYNTYNLSTLLKWWKNKKLIIPSFQRAYVWNQTKASEFVDSILRGLPVPSFFFYDDIDQSKYLVVDGQQRLHSLFAYIEEGTFSDKPFKLIGNIHFKWKGKTFKELETEYQEKLKDALMNVTVMRQLLPDDGQSSMYLSFQRLNTGGISLNAQEIRMSVSYGLLAEYLQELSSDIRYDKWSILRTNEQKKNSNYSRTQEFLLKFFAYYFSYPNFSESSTRKMIDKFFSIQKDFDNPSRSNPLYTYHSKKEFIEAYNAAAEIILSLSNEDVSPYNKPTQTFIEAIWVGLTHRKLILQKDIDKSTLPAYIKKWKEKIGEEEFERLFKARRTSSTSAALERIKAGIEYFSGDF